MSPPGLLQRVAAYDVEFRYAGVLHGVDPMLLASVCERESACGWALKPPGPAGLGDDRHGHGLMQIDDRSWGDWLRANDWRDPRRNICFGAGILKHELDRFGGDEFLACAAYNCGGGMVHKALLTCGALPLDQRNHVIDSYTAGRNYASDVLFRRDLLKGAHLADAGQGG